MKIYSWKRFGAFLVIVFLFILLLVHCCSSKPMEVEHLESYEVECGDTLWSIASHYRPAGMNIQEYLWNIRQLNNKVDCTIYPREVLTIPIFEEV